MNRRLWRGKAKGAPSGIPQAVRDAVLLRDGHLCRRCGASCLNIPSSIHHRLPRGRGGDARLSNLVRLCGTGTTGCHGAVESHRAGAYADGWLVPTGQDPTAVWIVSLDRLSIRWLTDDGEVLVSRFPHVVEGLL